LAQVEAALRIEHEAVRTRLVARPTAARRCARVAGRLEKFRHAFALLPLHDDVVGNVREQNKLARLAPGHALGPDEPLGDLLEPGILGHKLVEAWIEPLDRADRFLGGERPGDGEVHGEHQIDSEERRHSMLLTGSTRLDHTVDDEKPSVNLFPTRARWIM